jgi:hypothetical protein
MVVDLSKVTAAKLGNAVHCRAPSAQPAIARTISPPQHSAREPPGFAVIYHGIEPPHRSLCYLLSMALVVAHPLHRQVR